MKSISRTFLASAMMLFNQGNANIYYIEHHLPSSNIPVPAIIIGVGQIAYNKGPVATKGLFECTSLILDYGQGESIIAHAMPSIYREWFRGIDVSKITHYADGEQLFTDSIVDKVISEGEKHGLSSKNAEAVIYAGSKDSLDEVTGMLQAKGIKVNWFEVYSIEGEMRGFPGRSIIYNPHSKELKTK
jgi:hypothetical protein